MDRPLYRSLAESFRLDIFMPRSGLNSPPVSTYAADECLMEAMSSGQPPQSVLLGVDDRLNVLNAAGGRLYPMDECLRMIRGKAVPIIRLKTEQAAVAAAEYARTNNLGDVTICVPYEKRDILKKIRGMLPLSRGMLDLRETETTDLYCLIGQCSESEATMVLTSGQPDRETVRRLQKRFIQVWADGTDDLIPAVMSGACGVLTQNTETLYDLLERFPAGSTLRPTPLYAHKTYHVTGEYPENSIAGCAAAGERGYDAAEIDVQLTKDDVMVVHHDRDTGNLFDRKHVVFETGWETLRQARRKAFPESGLDRMDDLMVRMAEYPETPVLIEIKTPPDTCGVEEMVRQLSVLLKQEDVQKACTCIMGVMPPYLSYVHERLPFLPAAHCTYVRGQEATDCKDENNQRIYAFAQETKGANAGFNPYHPMVGHMFTRLAHVRGITVFPWTWAFEPWEECREAMIGSYLQGHDGLTSDWVGKFYDVPTDVRGVASGVYPAGERVCVGAEAYLRGRGWTGTENGVELIALDNGVRTEDHHYAVGERGRQRVAVGIWTELEDGSCVCVFGKACEMEFR